MVKHVKAKDKTNFYIRLRLNGKADKFVYFKNMEAFFHAKQHLLNMMTLYSKRNPKINPAKIEYVDDGVINITLSYRDNPDTDKNQYETYYQFLAGQLDYLARVFKRDDNKIFKLRLACLNQYTRKTKDDEEWITQFESIYQFLFYLPAKGDMEGLIEKIVERVKENLNSHLMDITYHPPGEENNVSNYTEYAGYVNTSDIGLIIFINDLYQNVYKEFKKGKLLPKIDGL